MSEKKEEEKKEKKKEQTWHPLLRIECNKNVSTIEARNLRDMYVDHHGYEPHEIRHDKSEGLDR